jgi:hypothetical protein
MTDISNKGGRKNRWMPDTPPYIPIVGGIVLYAGGAPTMKPLSGMLR